MSSRYAKQKSNPDNTSNIRYQKTPGSEHIQKGAMFQWYLSLVVAKAVFTLPLVLYLYGGNLTHGLLGKIRYPNAILLEDLLC